MIFVLRGWLIPFQIRAQDVPGIAGEFGIHTGIGAGHTIKETLLRQSVPIKERYAQFHRRLALCNEYALPPRQACEHFRREQFGFGHVQPHGIA